MAPINQLRPIIQRLNLTPVADLPRYAGPLAASVLNCSDLLQNPDDQSNEQQVQLHKLVTRVSSLLQDRTPEGRFTGLVLTKSLVEAGGMNLLASAGSVWVRNMLSCLNKTDPIQVKRLAIISTTRIFSITFGDQTLTREITTPSLPAFLTTCLNLIKPTIITINGSERQVPSLLLLPTLQCWTELAKCFPSTFRPFVPSIRAILLSILSSDLIPRDVKESARILFVTLHFCAPKDKSAAEWNDMAKLVLGSAHQAADLVFRSVIEEWICITPRQTSSTRVKRISDEIRASEIDQIGMEQWTGIQAGTSRLLELIGVLGALVVHQHAQTVRIPIAEMLDLGARLAAVLPPTQHFSLRDNKEIGKEEREELYMNLPRIHCVLLELYRRIATTYQHAFIQVSQTILVQIGDIFQSEPWNVHIRIATYDLMKSLLEHRAILILPKNAEQIAHLVRNCCNDLKTATEQHNEVNGTKSASPKTSQSQTRKEDLFVTEPSSVLQKAAWDLLPAIMLNIPASIVSSSLRTEIDRTAILSKHQDLLLASAMQPPTSRRGARQAPSILPFLTMAGDGDLAIEALLRPRQPVLRSTVAANAASDEILQEDPETDMQDTASKADLSKLNEHITEQVEMNPSEKDSETQQARKRTLTSVEDATSSTNTEASKKARMSSFTSVLGESDKPSLTKRVAELEVEDSTILANAERVSLQEKVPSSVVSPQEEGQKSETLMRPEPLATNHADAQEDDSDDSEIPMIDAALTSDEDEDDLAD